MLGTPEQWRTAIREVVGYAADEKFQREHWAGTEKYLVTPAEIYNILDDWEFDKCLADAEVGLNERQCAAGQDLAKKLAAFDKPVDSLTDAEVVDHPLWIEVPKAAGRFLDALKVD